LCGIGVATPHLRGGGSIVVLASLAGLTPYPDNPFYAMTKAGVVALVRSLGPALHRDGIRIAAVCPGSTDTPMVAPIRDVIATAGFPLLEAKTVADAVIRAADEGEGGRLLGGAARAGAGAVRVPRGAGSATAGLNHLGVVAAAPKVFRQGTGQCRPSTWE
jgi:short-subunit dehydrogenase